MARLAAWLKYLKTNKGFVKTIVSLICVLYCNQIAIKG